MKLRHLVPDGQLKPMTVLNMILVVVIIAAFGIAHTWLGMQQKRKNKELTDLQGQIQRANNEIRRLDVDQAYRSSAGSIASQMDTLGLTSQLQRITKDDVVTLKLDGGTP